VLVYEPVGRRVAGVPIAALAGGAVILVVLAALAYLIGPHLGALFVDENLDPSALPNSSAVAAGAPAPPQVTQLRATPAARATAAANATNTAAAANSAPGTSASATSAASAPPQPTLPPEPTAVAAPPGTSVIEESFANNSRNWPSSTVGTALLTNGSYRLVPRQVGQFVAIGAPITDVPQDVIVSAAFHKVSGPVGGGYGIIMRDQAAVPQNGTNQDGHYYVLEAGDKGEIGIWRRDGNAWVDLVAWKRSDAVKTGTATNELTASAIGNRLSLSVNGTQVASITDGTYSSGNVGLFSGGDGNQVVVDRLSVQTP
jgi:hypothetical protein